MGNTPLTCVSGAGKVQKIRVLLPDANIVLMDQPVQVVDLMIEYINHMVVHCSTARPGAMGTRPSMTIMQPDEMLQPGQAYVVHPIPSKFQKFKPQPLSIPKHNSRVHVQSTRDKRNGESDKNQEPAETRKQRHARRCQNKVVDSEDAAEGPQLKSVAGNTPQSLDHHVDARKYQQDLEDLANAEDDDEDDELLLNLNMYMGWRPALESIPESPLGYNHQLDVMQAPPLLYV